MNRDRRRPLFAPSFMMVCLTPFVASCCSRVDRDAPEEATASDRTPVAREIGTIRPLHLAGNVYLAGQPSADDLDALKAEGCTSVITLRTDGELAWDEKAKCESIGVAYHAVPFRAPDTLTDDVFDRVRELLETPTDGRTLLHCGSSNRVGAVWLAHRVLDDGVPWEEALGEAHRVGLRNAGYEARAKEYVEARQ